MSLIGRLKRWVPRPLRRSERLRGRIEAVGGVVSGPFSGMRYVSEAICSSLGPKILGTYELEVESVIVETISAQPERILVVGGGEGYYAVGLAIAVPGAVVVVFEAEERGRALIRQLAGLNGVSSRIEILGFCDPQSLSAVLRPEQSTFLLMDVEGGEETLLDPARIPGLALCEILVETHDFVSAGIDKRIVERFSATHSATAFSQKPRHVADVRNLDVPKVLHGALSTWLPEGRPEGNAWIHPKQKSTRPLVDRAPT